MGGHAVGDLASRLVIDALSHLAPPLAMKTCIADARARLQKANRQLRDEAARRQVQRIGSTVVVLLACDRFCGYLWAGDSRLYLYREGQLRQLTRDHSQVEELKSLGVITDEEARHHPAQHMITRAVGATDLLELDDDAIEVADGDVFLLCSDGLSNEISDEEILGVLTTVTCERASDELVDLAIARGGRDNVTAVVVHAEDPYASDKTLLNPAP
ncbi:Protein phosphatase PrpC [Paraburkholderia nemoris]|uniref:Protein phosphatase PrpC n=2 Tax=Paraburkholderia nemoris TaxID=2793076 RepID=A0ABN7MKQ1_9BURK|nr:Protein phosphatase PrpC [Paraburkholderia nemoris]CAE6810644.1 Protein phosphatase PrpC [Paraburkholderia nemoris]